MESGRDNELILEVIRLGVQAGGCWKLSREEVAAAPGLESLARNYNSLGTMLMDGIERTAETVRSPGETVTRAGTASGMGLETR